MLGNQLFLAAVIGIPSLILALWHGNVWLEATHNKLGFKWGYFVIYNTLISNILLFGYWIILGLDYGETGLLTAGLLSLLVSLFVTYFAIKRSQWALVATTLLSLNPLWMIINIFYLRNRWDEFRSEAVERSSVTSIKGPQQISKDIRIALFIAVTWGVCVPAYTFLFRPYGRTMWRDDFIHMISVILVPTLVGLGLFFIYRRFIRS